MPETMQRSKIISKFRAAFDSSSLVFDILSQAAISARENEFTACSGMR
jgi:hypothetical protein